MSNATVPATSTLLQYYRQMLLIRRFEERLLDLSRRGLLAGSIHLAVGQEAVAVGAAAALRADDRTLATYRGHHHVLARGVDPYRAMAEVLGRASGLCQGRGGSMHLTDIEKGVLPPNSIVGASLPIAVGTALAQKRASQGALTLCAFGEGALNQGGALEALNLAAIWSLPLIFLCENNLYSEMTPAYQMLGGSEFGDRAAASGLATARVDGMDVLSVAEVVTQAAEKARSGQPSFIEATTYRFLGHYQGDSGTGYRAAAEVEEWKARDPLTLLASTLNEHTPAQSAEMARVESEINALLDNCEGRVLADPLPEAETLERDLYVQ